MEREEVVRVLAAAETKSAGADVIVADAEARRVAAEVRAVHAEADVERVTSERDIARAAAGPLARAADRLHDVVYAARALCAEVTSERVHVLRDALARYDEELAS